MVDGRDDIRHLLAGLEGVNRHIGALLGARHRAQGFLVRGSEGRILSLIGPTGTRPSALADGAWITKQAMGKRIHDMAARGLVELEPDPEDGRALLVRRTAHGDRVLAWAEEQIADVEDELAQIVGDDRYAVFRAVVDELARGHLPPALIAAAGPPGTTADRR